jgi:pilus assembly protein TadC
MPLRLVLFEEFGKAFVPKRVRPYLRRYLLKAGISPVPYKFFGALFYLTAFITAIIYIFFIYPFLTQYSQFILLIFSFLSWFVIQLFFAILFIILVYFYLDLKIYNRTRQMEDLLPDFLQIVSSNLKGGLSFENSLWAAIKPRFSILANEMAEVSKKVMTGYDVDKALMELSEKYNSPMLSRAVDLIISELESGGNIAQLIDRIVDNMRRTKVLKEDMAASALAYILFISIIVILISPLLFSLSFYLLNIISNFLAKVSTATKNVPNIPFTFAKVVVNPTSFKIFSISAISVISLFSSMIVSIVEKGDVRGGIKYIPMFLAGSLVFYFIFMKILSYLFLTLYVG